MSTLLLSVFFCFPASKALAQHNELPDYGHHFIRILPFQVMDVGIGPGISYEQLIGKEKKVGLVFPISVLLEDQQDYYGYGHNPLGSSRYATYVYFSPGFKVYTAKEVHAVTYAFGPNLMLGYGGIKNKEYVQWDDQNYFTFKGDESYFSMGVMANNYLNFQLSESFTLGTSLGLGIKYINRRSIKNSILPQTINDPIEAVGQWSINIGYRF